MITYTTAQVIARHPLNTELEVCHAIYVVAGEQDPITAEQYARVAARLEPLVEQDAPTMTDAEQRQAWARIGALAAQVSAGLLAMTPALEQVADFLATMRGADRAGG